MSNWKDLPLELVFKVVANLPPRDLKAASLAFSRLRIPCQELLFTQIAVEDCSTSESESVDNKNSVSTSATQNSQAGDRLFEFLQFFLRERHRFSRTECIRFSFSHSPGSGDDIGWVKSSRREFRESQRDIDAQPNVIEERDQKKHQIPLRPKELLAYVTAQDAGIPIDFAARFPLSSVFLTLLHLLPNIRHLTVSPARLVLPSLILTVYGAANQVPVCVRELVSLTLEETNEHLTISSESPNALIDALPKLRSFKISGWGTFGAWDEDPSTRRSTEPSQKPPTTPGSQNSTSNHQISTLVFDNTAISINTVRRALAMTSNLEVFEYNQQAFKPPRYQEIHDQKINCHTLWGDLKEHAKSLQILKISWKSLAGFSDNTNPIFFRGTFNRLSTLPSLKHLVLPAHLLFGPLGPLVRGERLLHQNTERLFASLLPPSLITLEIGLSYSWRIEDFLRQVKILSDWPSVRAEVFHNLKEFRLSYQHMPRTGDKGRLRRYGEIRLDLAKIGVNLTILLVDK